MPGLGGGSAYASRNRVGVTGERATAATASSATTPVITTADGSPEAERDVVEAAIREERGPNETPSRAYVVGPEETPPKPLVALVDRFRSHDRIREDEAQYRNALAGPYLVRYEGALYWTQLSVYGPPLVSPTPTPT